MMDIIRTYKDHNFITNNTKLQKNINKQINFIIKRKTSSLPEYTPDMGALSENDIIYYLTELQKTILKLNNSFFGRDYLNINLTTNKFLTKINFTYLEKLRLSFDVKLVKFSTILTDKSIQKLKNIILKQFYLIEEYVHKSSNLVQLKINNFLNELNKTSDLFQSLSGYIHNQALGYYRIFHTTIQNKYEEVKEKRLRLLDITGKSVWTKKDENTKITFMEVIGTFQIESQQKFDLGEILKACFPKAGSISDKIEDYTKKLINFQKKISIPFPAFPYFQIHFYFGAYVGIGLYPSLEQNFKELELNLGLDVYVEVKVPISLEAGLYFPPKDSPIQIGFVVGIDGTICHGRAGIKLWINLLKGKFDYDAYFIFNPLVFEFYFQLKMEIDLVFYQYKFSFDIIRVELFGIHIEYHSKKEEAFKKNIKGNMKQELGLDILSPNDD